RGRLGAPKAVTATAHKLARIVYGMMRFGAAYVQETEAAYAEQVRARTEKQLRRRARELGYEVGEGEAAPPPAGAEGAARAGTGRSTGRGRRGRCQQTGPAALRGRCAPGGVRRGEKILQRSAIVKRSSWGGPTPDRRPGCLRSSARRRIHPPS